jgi:hypothetical protein
MSNSTTFQNHTLQGVPVTDSHNAKVDRARIAVVAERELDSHDDYTESNENQWIAWKDIEGGGGEWVYTERERKWNCLSFLIKQGKQDK